MNTDLWGGRQMFGAVSTAFVGFWHKRQTPLNPDLSEEVVSVAGPPRRHSLPWSALYNADRRFKQHSSSQDIAVQGLRDAVELIPAAIVGIGDGDEILLANKAASALFGLSHAALRGAPAQMLFPLQPAAHEAVSASRAETTSDSPANPMHQPATNTLVARREGGDEFLAEVLTNVCWLDGIRVRLTVIIDRTEWDELYRNRQELAHLTRVSTLGELAGSLAHELNQPLTAILSNTQAAQRFLDQDPPNLAEIRETLKDVVADDCRAGEIIRRIRTLAKKGNVEFQLIEIDNVIRDVALLVHSDAVVRGIRMSIEIADDLPRVRGDRVQLQQVVLNLLLNAFDAVHECRSADRTVTVHAGLSADGTVRIAVADRGAGLTVEQMERIFKPFFTSKAHGLGLGLSISRTIVTTHGGRLWAENNAEGGATFYLTLPAEQAQQPLARSRNP